MNPFSNLGIRHDIVNAITELGFENPTPIQEQSIPVLLSGSNDFVGLAQTGTGKTAAFGLPLLELLDFEENYPQVKVAFIGQTSAVIGSHVGPGALICCSIEE